MALVPVTVYSPFTSAEIATLIAFADGLATPFPWMEPETPQGLIDGSNVTYTLSYVPLSFSGILDINGQLLREELDWNIDQYTITMTAPLDASLSTGEFTFKGQLFLIIPLPPVDNNLILQDSSSLLLQDSTNLLLNS